MHRTIHHVCRRGSMAHHRQQRTGKRGGRESFEFQKISRMATDRLMSGCHNLLPRSFHQSSLISSSSVSDLEQKPLTQKSSNPVIMSSLIIVRNDFAFTSSVHSRRSKNRHITMTMCLTLTLRQHRMNLSTTVSSIGIKGNALPTKEKIDELLSDLLPSDLDEATPSQLSDVIVTAANSILSET